MSFIVENWMLIVLAAVSGGMLLAPQLRTVGKSIGTAEAVRMLNHQKGVLIDVSEPAEYAAGHVAGARNVPLASLPTSKDLPSNKALPLILLCASGSRASRAARELRKLGYESVHPLSGGNAAWREASLPMERSKAK